MPHTPSPSRAPPPSFGCHPALHSPERGLPPPVPCKAEPRCCCPTPTSTPSLRPAAFAYPNTAYFAAGAGWLAVPIDRSEPVGQQSIVQDVALALHGHVGIGAKAPRVSPAGG